jgi:hypothetical protein
MVVRLNTGEELRCNSNAINARDFVFGSQTTMAMKTNAVVDRYVNQIMRAVERQSLHGAYAE